MSEAAQIGLSSEKIVVTELARNTVLPIVICATVLALLTGFVPKLIMPDILHQLGHKIGDVEAEFGDPQSRADLKYDEHAADNIKLRSEYSGTLQVAWIKAYPYGWLLPVLTLVFGIGLIRRSKCSARQVAWYICTADCMLACWAAWGFLSVFFYVKLFYFHM